MRPAREQLPFSVVAWTVSALVVAAIPHLLAMPPPLSALIALACGWRLLAARQRWPLPPRWLRTLLTVAAIIVLAVSYGGLWGRRAATGLLCLMLGAKMLELGRARDLRMVASVALFLVAAQFLFNERLIYLVYLIASVLVATGTLIRIQQFELGKSPAPGGDRRILSESAVMLLAALPMALILFVAFPRLAEPLWGLPDAVMDGKTGLSDSMSPGSIANLYIDDSPAFRAQFSAAPPPPEQRYWRGPVLWHFDGDTWKRAFLPSKTPAVDVPQGGDDYLYTVQLEPHERRWLFALDYPVSRPDQAHVSLDFQITRRHPVTTLTEYQMRSNPEFADMLRLPGTLRQLALNLPGDRNPRTREMARQLRARFSSDRALINHVLGWLREEPFFYSLQTAPLGRHGADEFLFDLRTGYCEYYASAFAVLMRAADIPARIVTGYQGGYWQSGGEYLLVRQSDAHAWVEVWLDDGGWTRVDPTAAVSPERIESGTAALAGGGRRFEWLRALRNRYDRVQHLWNAWVLGFDASRQQRLMRLARLPELTPIGMAALMTALLSLTVAALAWLWLRQPVRSGDPVQRAWLKLVRRMQRRGLGPGPGETPLAWAERIGPLLDGRGHFQALIMLYCRIRYGDEHSVELRERFIRESRKPAEPRSCGNV